MIIFVTGDVSGARCRLSLFVMDVTEHPGYKDFVWAIELNRLGLHFLGLWPGIDEATKNSFASELRAGIIFVSTILMLITPILCSLVRVWGDMMLMVDNLQTGLPLMVTVLKVITIWVKRSVVSSVLRMMAEDWMTVKTNTERNVMIRRARTGRLIVIMGYILMGFALTMAIFIPMFGPSCRQITNLTDGDRPLPLQTYYFYDTDKSPQFELTLFSQAMLTFLSTVAYTSMDALLGLAILHICGQLENFRHRLGNLNFRKNFNAALRENVQTHLRLIRFANTIDDIFAIMMLGLVFYFAIAFCIFGFIVIAVFTDETMNDISFLRKYYGAVGVVVVFAHTFLYCLAGEIMASECEAIYATICNLEWYNLEYKKGRIITLLMLRASKSFQITAGNIIPLTMTSFCNLLKTSVGYISVLMARKG